MYVENDTIKIGGYTLKKDENEFYMYYGKDFNIIAFEFLSGKMPLPHIEYIDIYSCVLISSNYYIYYGIDNNGKEFCL